MSDQIKTLDKIVEEVVWNEDIRGLLNGSITDGKHPYKKLVDFQLAECRKRGVTIHDAGFQIGEPWDGDIEHAPILFLSSNPACDWDEVSPRYHANTDTVSKALSLGGDGNIQWGPEMTPEDIKTFIGTRIRTAPGSGKSLHIPLLNGKTKAVPYWGSARNNTEELLPFCVKNKLKGMTPKDKAREIMKYAVCMEIVPFRSNSEIGVMDALDKCWTEFTRHILAQTAATVFVLVGDKARDKFLCQAVTDGAKQARKVLDAGEIYPYSIDGKTRSVVCVKVNQGKMRRFSGYFPKATRRVLEAEVAALILAN